MTCTHNIQTHCHQYSAGFVKKIFLGGLETPKASRGLEATD